MKILGISLVILALLCSALTVVHFYLLDGLDGWFLSLAGEDTVYPAGYSDSGFRRVYRDMPETALLELLGPPLGEVWIYSEKLPSRLNSLVSFAGDVVDQIRVERAPSLLRVVAGMERRDVLQVAGSPREKVFIYSQSRGDQSYRVRTVTLVHGRVTRVKHCFYAD